MIRARIVQVSLEIFDIDGLTVSELADWIKKAFLYNCKFDYAEIEYNNSEQVGPAPLFMCYLILNPKKYRDLIAVIKTAMIDFCHFEDAEAKIIYELEDAVVNEDYSIPTS